MPAGEELASLAETIAETVAYYRERKIGLVMFTVDAETQLGRRRIPNEEVAEAARQMKVQFIHGRPGGPMGV